MVVDRYHGVLGSFGQCPDKIVGTLLHLRIGTLNGIQFYAVGIATGVYGGDTAAAETNSIVVATHNNHLITFPRCAFQAVSPRAIAYASGQHNHLIIGVFFGIFAVFKRQYGAGNQRLSELIAKVAGAIRGLDEYLFGCLVEPQPSGQAVFPLLFTAQTRIGRHVNGCSGDRPRACSSAHTVSYLASCACSCSVERFHGSGEIMGFGFQRDNALDVSDVEIIACCEAFGGEKLYHGTLGESYVVFIGTEYTVGMFAGGSLNQSKQG